MSSYSGCLGCGGPPFSYMPGRWIACIESRLLDGTVFQHVSLLGHVGVWGCLVAAQLVSWMHALGVVEVWGPGCPPAYVCLG